MYIQIDGVNYACTQRYFPNGGICFMLDTMPQTVSGEILLCADSGFLLASYDTAEYARTEIEGNTLTLTNAPEVLPHIPTTEELRAAAGKRIEGKCSGAIYGGLNIGAKHYSFTQQAQANIKGLLIEAQQGKVAFLYAADGEPLSTHTAEQIQAIARVMGEWINVNLAYNEQLRAWIARETASAVLGGIDYGVTLPADLMAAMGAKLAAVGVDAGAYAGMMGG